MKIRGPVSITEIVEATGLSRATVDRVLNKRPGVHPRTQAHVLRVLARLENDGQPWRQEPFVLEKRDSYRFGIVVQAGETFTRSVLDMVQKVTETESGAANLQAVASRSDEETIELTQTVGRDLDGVALVSKNIEPIKSA